jgi:hypothetical protein
MEQARELLAARAGSSKAPRGRKTKAKAATKAAPSRGRKKPRANA